MSETVKVKPLKLDTLLAVLRGSVGTKMFQHFYASVDGKKTDIMQNGDLSCAFFVSSVLAMMGLLDRAHGTVLGTVKMMEKSGWLKTRVLKPGVVLVWDYKIGGGGEKHQHIGFYLGENMAISNSDLKKVPIIHPVNFGSLNSKQYRKIVGIYKHDELK